MSSGSRSVAVVMGSESDREVVAPALAVLDEFGVPRQWRVLSAHRTPEEAAAFAAGAAAAGVGVIIAAAGGAAHLPGVLAAHTVLPVLGLPVRGPALGGLDSLLSMAQMPPGVPVGTVGIDGARNAALLAVAILALGEPRLSQALLEFRRRQAERVLQSDSRISALPPGGAGA
jgi:phosphoribosylaminoimidazole carboxylase PurE protein